MPSASRSLLAFLLVLAMVLAGCSHPRAPAGTERVQPMQPNLNPGGRAVAVSVDPTDANRIVVASETGGLFRSTDQGTTWSHVSGTTSFWFTDVAHVPAAPSVVLASASPDTRVASGGGVYRSTDGGASWARVTVVPTAPACVAGFGALALEAERDRGRVWAGTVCGLAFSDDQGLSWSFVAPSAEYNNDRVYSVVAPAPGRIAILTDQGVKVSTDDAVSWTRSTTGLPGGIWGGGPHNYLAAAPNDADHLYRVFHYGTTNAAGDWEVHVTLFRSLDFGGSWSAVIDDPGLNRPPFVRTALALAGGSGSYDVYWSDGGCRFQRATVTTGSASTVGAWTSLGIDHCDPTDVAFGTDRRTPLLLASDGGLHRTTNNGASWTFTGGGVGGYNALQITEVTGQLHAGRASADLYFGTQDNDVWASPDYGVTWPTKRCCEGFFLNVWREPLPAADTRFTGVSCGACGNFMSGPRLAGQTGFPNPPNDAGNPRLLEPGAYVHNTRIPGLAGNVFALTTDNGGAWTSRYGFPEDVRDLSKVSGPRGDPVVFTAVRIPGATAWGGEVMQIKRIADVLGTSTPLVSNVGGGASGLNSLGIYPTMFAWYKPFAVHPTNPNVLIASDVVDQQVKMSGDGGATWAPNPALTALVTGAGTYKFSWDSFTQTSTFAFNPDCSGHVVVGTRQAGIMESTDGGTTWAKIPGSERIPEVSSVFFGKKDGRAGEMIVSSYGRGLWKVTYDCPPGLVIRPPRGLELLEPVIYWKGGKVPISQLGNPDACPVCVYHLLEGGRVLDYRVEEDKLVSLVISGGEMRGYTYDGTPTNESFAIEKGETEGDFGGDEGIKDALEGKTQVKGVLVEDGKLRGLLLHTQDLTPDDLPKVRELGPHIRVSIDGPQEAYRMRPIVVRGAGFVPGEAVEVLVDGERPAVEKNGTVQKDGSFEIVLAPLFDVGGHTILVRQKTGEGLVQDASTFILTVSDEETEQRELQKMLG